MVDSAIDDSIFEMAPSSNSGRTVMLDHGPIHDPHNARD
jgi:hypothetical protein